MNFIRKNFYLASIVVVVLFVGMIVAFREQEPDVLPLKNRVGGTSMGNEWINTRQVIESLLDKVRRNPDDVKSRVQLAQAYIQEARITGDFNYYDPACIKLLNAVLKQEPDHYEAMATLATVYLSQHHFEEGLSLGKKAQRLNPHAAFIYGVLTDAYVELGKYDSAVMMADSMCGIRPDLRSYSRMSYLREIHGDIPGAIEVMKMALAAGIPGMEQTEWVRVYLGKLYLMCGKTDTAAWLYQAANTYRPNYAYALAGLGEVERIKKNYAEAIRYYEQAASLVKDYSFGDELVELHRLSGEMALADSIEKVVIQLLSEHANTNEEDGDAGHYADKELAWVYLKQGDYDAALKHAAAEYNRRPANIEVNELMAWIHFQRGAYEKSVPFMEQALRTGCNNPELLCRAGLIYGYANQPEKANLLLKQAQVLNPFLDESLLRAANDYLAQHAPTIPQV